jgi:hypothetical protein
MGPWGIAIDHSNRVVVSETFPGRVQVFRYITDAEAAALKARREATEGNTAVTPVASGQDASATKPAASSAKPDVAAKKDPAAQ